MWRRRRRRTRRGREHIRLRPGEGKSPGLKPAEFIGFYRGLKPAATPKSARLFHYGVAAGFSLGSGMLARMSLAPQELRTYFTTFSTLGRRRLFQVERNSELMLRTLQGYREQGKFSLHAFVVMPDHIHALLTPAPEVSLEKAIQFIKGGFSFRLKSSSGIWERGHFDKRVPDRTAYVVCVTYIHQNPVLARLVECEVDYQFSSAMGRAEVDAMPGWFDQREGSSGRQAKNPGAKAP
jgi:putative transposase